MTISLQDALQRTIEHREIFHDEMLSLMRRIMSGEVTPVMIAALTVGLRVKKETIGEIAAAAQVMREFATKVEVADREQAGRHRRHRRRRAAHVQHLDRVDVRRGGGGRARGQARRPLGVVEVGQRRRARGARRQHHAVARRGRAVHRRDRHGLHVRAEPPRGDEARGAGAPRARRAHDLQHPRAADQPGRRAATSSIGVFHPDLVGIHVRVLQRLGAKHVLVVYGTRRHGRGLARRRDDGRRAEGRRGARVRDPPGGLRDRDEVAPRPQGRRRGGVEGHGARGARRTSTGRRARSSSLNAGTALYAADVAASIGEGIERARAAIASGAARRKLDAFVATTQKLATKS